MFGLNKDHLLNEPRLLILLQIVLIGLLLPFWSCSGHKNISIVPADPAVEAKFQEASSLYAKGCFVSLTKAAAIYRDLYAHPALRRRTADPYFRTSLLLLARERELSIPSGTGSETTIQLVRENASLRRYQNYLEMASLILPKTGGVVQDIDPNFGWKANQEKLEKNWEAMKREAGQDELLAYLLSAWHCSYGTYSDRRTDRPDFSRVFPSSILLKYNTATCGQGNDKQLLEEIIRQDPEFFEARYHLARLHIQEGKFVSAENEFLKAADGITASPQIFILLASLYLASEEFEKGLEYYQKTLALSPEYRDALLGQAICLASLKRSDEAIAVLDKILSLGFWLIGEAHYWLAWNKNELGLTKEALQDIDEAKSRLPTNSEVFSLSGSLALKFENDERAQKDFVESLKHDPSNSESCLGLGNIFSARKNWIDAAAFYEKAARALEKSATSIAAKIDEIRTSELSAERKERMIRRNEQKLQILIQSTGMAYCAASENLFNGGNTVKARELALLAAQYPEAGEKAAELLKRKD